MLNRASPLSTLSSNWLSILVLSITLLAAACSPSSATSPAPDSAAPGTTSPESGATQPPAGTKVSKAQSLQLTLGAGIDPMMTVTSVLNPKVTLDAGVSDGSASDTPDFFITHFDGQNFRLSEQKGKIVVINFWASWCGPCRHEMPDLMTVWQKNRDRGVVFIGIDTDDDPERGLIFAQRLGVAYPLGYDKNNVIAKSYLVKALPTTIVVAKDGKTNTRIPGMTTATDLQTLLDSALAE